jgi:hypothetical protein
MITNNEAEKGKYLQRHPGATIEVLQDGGWKIIDSEGHTRIVPVGACIS